jgi:hypothetical protein
MKSFVLLLFVVGIVMTAIGYQKNMMREYEIEKHIEYRFIPRSIYDEQLGQAKLTPSFEDMFERPNMDFYIERN